MKWLWLALTITWLFFFSRGGGGIPAPARLLDLHAGLWSHHSQTLNDQTLPGLRQPVQIAWDKNGVPHFFAQNEEDLYRAQGYVMASQRLFQMDLSTRHISGRLSEWIGEKALKSDQFFISFGMRDSARKTLAHFMEDPQTRQTLLSFTQGINSYIEGLKQLPPEYILLGVKPEPFTPLNVIYMDKSLTFNLAGRSMATLLTPLLQRLGAARVLDLFPEFLPAEYEDFIVPGSGRPPRAPETAELFSFVSHLKEIPSFPLANPGNGSNNWAVSPKRSTTGHSILANDTHLNYSLPNVWYEVQLTSPQFNVYGVTLVSVPGIINGFNGKTAWGPTNGTTTVLDWFEIEFENETSQRYKYKDQWLDPEIFPETLDVKGQAAQSLDVVWTRLGPLMHREGRYGLVANWMGHRPNEELKALRGLIGSKDMNECLKSLSENWAVPIQNFICADADHIGLLHAGRVPKREIGEGRFIMDGSLARDSLAQTVRDREHPQVIDPAMVLSANQKIEDPSYPNYLGWDYEEPFRGRMIRRRLAQKDRFSPEDMMEIQNDNYDLSAESILPWLLRNIRPESLSPVQQNALERVQHWDYSVKALESEPVLFRAWYVKLKNQIIERTFKTSDPQNRIRDLRIAWMLKRLTENANDSDIQWTGKPLAELVTESFKQAWQDLELRFGPQPEQWTWDKFNATALRHVARLPGWGSEVLKMDGSGQSIRGNHGDHGPTYKAVFELGEKPRVWMQVPGGNEGDPLNPAFERNVEAWSQGQMREVEYYKNIEEARARAERFIELRP